MSSYLKSATLTIQHQSCYFLPVIFSSDSQTSLEFIELSQFSSPIPAPFLHRPLYYKPLYQSHMQAFKESHTESRVKFQPSLPNSHMTKLCKFYLWLKRWMIYHYIRTTVVSYKWARKRTLSRWLVLNLHCMIETPEETWSLETLGPSLD